MQSPDGPLTKRCPIIAGWPTFKAWLFRAALPPTALHGELFNQTLQACFQFPHTELNSAISDNLSHAEVQTSSAG
jgi:hypothetical protein